MCSEDLNMLAGWKDLVFSENYLLAYQLTSCFQKGEELKKIILPFGIYRKDGYGNGYGYGDGDG